MGEDARAPGSRMRAESRHRGQPKLSMGTKASLSTPGQAQASAGSTPSDWLLCSLFAFGA